MRSSHFLLTALLAASALAVRAGTIKANPSKTDSPKSAASASSAKPVAAVPAAAPATETLDQKKIHADYSEGNFDQVTNALEGFMRRNKTYDRADSVFIAKHLAVVYSANPATREKGKYYMNKLLELVPSAKLVDMYVSDEIDHIFEKVKEEYLDRQKGFGVDSTMVSLPERAPSNAGGSNAPGTVTATVPSNGGKGDGSKKASEAKADDSHTGLWIAAGAGVAAAGALTYYFINNSNGKPADKRYVVPE